MERGRSNQVFQAARPVDDAFDHDTFSVHGKEDEIAVVDGLPKTGGEVVPALKGAGPFRDA